mgnify:CR=1 FL=1
MMRNNHWKYILPLLLLSSCIKPYTPKLDDNAVVIVSTNSEQKRNSDVNYPFRPDSSFWYLTGFIEPDAIAVFSKNNYI